VTNRHVPVSDDEISLLGHGYIVLQVGDMEVTRLISKPQANQV